MSNTKGEYPREQVISILKEWASPVLIGLVGMLLWRDVTEMRADVKLLLTQQSADRVKIQQLEDDVKLLKTYVLTPLKSTPAQTPPPNETEQRSSPILKDEEYELVPKKKR
jgi:hypothetical protein